MNEVFRLQSDLAERVARALDITLLEPERQSLGSKPTENMEAYEYYLRGNEYMHRSTHENDLRIAVQMYEKALELDPTFALAYCELSRAHVLTYWHHYDHSEERLAMAKKVVDKAFELNPNLPEAHLALGHYYYHGRLDYDRALEQFAIARNSQPNNSKLLSWIGSVQRRQGKFEQALENLKKAAELDPRSKGSLVEAADILTRTRKYKEAEQYYERAISLTPDWPMPYPWKAQLYLLWEGSTEKARAVLQKGLQNISSSSLQFYDFLIKLDVYDENYQKVLDLLSLKSQDIDKVRHFIPSALRYALIYGYMDKKELAKKYYEDARSVLESKIKEWPEDARFHSSLGIAYAGLGRKEEAIQEGQLGIELLPVTKDAWSGPFRVEDLARIYLMVGEFDAAINKLEFLLSIPGEMSIPLLRLDPAWKPLRDYPRFKKLLESDK
jgi:serine/threonine-protein kinase